MAKLRSKPRTRTPSPRGKPDSQVHPMEQDTFLKQVAELPVQLKEERQIPVAVNAMEDDENSPFAGHYKSPFLAHVARFDAQLKHMNPLPGFFMPKAQPANAKILTAATVDEKNDTSFVPGSLKPPFRATRGPIAPTPATVRDKDDKDSANLVFNVSQQPFRATRGRIAPTPVTITANHNNNDAKSTSELPSMPPKTKASTPVIIKDDEDLDIVPKYDLFIRLEKEAVRLPDENSFIPTPAKFVVWQATPESDISELVEVQNAEDDGTSTSSEDDYAPVDSPKTEDNQTKEPYPVNSNLSSSDAMAKEEKEDKDDKPLTSQTENQIPMTKEEFTASQHALDTKGPPQNNHYKIPANTTTHLRQRLTKAQDDLLVAQYANVEQGELMRLRVEFKMLQMAIDITSGMEKTQSVVEVHWQKDEVFHRRLLTASLVVIALMLFGKMLY